MASKAVSVFALMLFVAFSIAPIRGRDLSKPVGSIALVKEENSSIGVNGHPPDYHMHTAGYYATGKWHGVRAEINVWGIPGVQPRSMSSAFIAAVGDKGDMVVAGIHVYPALYKNDALRFFTYWSTDGGVSTGCFNTLCKGFVITNGTNAVPGSPLSPPFSKYLDEQKYITLRIKKDDRGDWSLYGEDQGGRVTLLGWWPKTLFKGISDYAPAINLFGQVSYHFEEKSPPMGSGKHAIDLERKSAYFKHILAFDTNGEAVQNIVNTYRVEDKPDCYDVTDWYSNPKNGNIFYYGGASGCSDK